MFTTAFVHYVFSVEELNERYEALLKDRTTRKKFHAGAEKFYGRAMNEITTLQGTDRISLCVLLINFFL